MPNGNEAEDEYICTEPDGMVMFPSYPTGGAVDSLDEFNPSTNTISAITPPPDATGPYPVSFCNLPNGQVMVCCGSGDWLYTPASAPNNAWRPTVSSVTYNSGTTYTLTGTQLSGLISGGDEGDDMTMAENYPIVWLTNSTGKVWYCKSFNFSTMMPQAGSAPQTCEFTTPSGLASGTYSLYVSSVGVKSLNAFSFTTGSSSGGNLIANGTYVLTNVYSGQVADDTGNSTTEGTYICQWAANGQTNQEWTVTNLGSNVITLTNVKSGYLMDDTGNSLASGTEICQWPSNGGTNQEWTVTSIGSGYYTLKNVKSGLLLEDPDTTTDGTYLEQATAVSGGASYQAWTF